MTTKRTQPVWKSPSSSDKSELPNIKIYNSLTSQKENFVPLEKNNVKWYSCGPTVYDSSHMGHARTYISFDILRRILKDYFKYNVCYAMNITDIDDKIVKRARQKHLITSYKQNIPERNVLLNDIKESLKLLKTRSATEPEPEKKDYQNQLYDKISKFIESEDIFIKNVDEIFSISQDILSDYLDKLKGAEITDLKIFKELASHYEKEFHTDMRNLNILDADRIVRVSEYVEKIIEFIERIIANGYGYASKSGSVYFDTLKFDNDPLHFYAKLVPTAFGDMQKLSTGEGDLGETSEKLNACDFALWKASKPGEPYWPSPWGNGRPGWHIECSAMASGIFGPMMDIHSGGVDLKFPHHDNELAQSEAYHKNDSWVSYFLHSGHLTISGCKMSKSLKNFITIQEALKRNSARQLRIVFLKHSWREVLDYSPDTMTEAVNLEKSLYDFIFNANYLTRILISRNSENTKSSDSQVSKRYYELNKKLRTSIHTNLSDNFETRNVITNILQYISDMNTELSKNTVDSKSQELEVTAKAFVTGARMIVQTMSMFGAADNIGFCQPGITFDNLEDFEITSINPNQVPWISLDSFTTELYSEIMIGVEKSCQDFTQSLTQFKDEKIEQVIHQYKSKIEAVIAKNTASKDAEKDLWPIANQGMLLLAEYRQAIRELAQGNIIEDKTKKISLLKACDNLRDDLLPLYNIRLQDKALNGGNEADLPAIGYIPKWILSDIKKDKEKTDEKKKQEKAEKEKLLNEMAKINPKEMFLSKTDEYSKFDENGVPTHDAEGNELTKSKVKKLIKLQEAQEKKHTAWLEKNKAEFNVLI